MTPDEIRRYMQSIGIQDFEMGDVPSGYTNNGMVDPNAVYTPGGEYMGQYEVMPQIPAPGGLLYNQPQPMPTVPPASMSTDPVVNNMFQRNNTTSVDMSQIDRLLQNLNRYR